MLRPANDPGTPVALDLVVSFASWCFHYPAGEYLRGSSSLQPPSGTRLILEMRKGRHDWQLELVAAGFDPIAVCGESEKFVRWSMSRADTITVLAGGWSARAYLDRLEGTDHRRQRRGPSPGDIAVSMDRLWTEHRWDHLVEIGKPAWLRRSRP
jgi:hypothetical protein